MTGIDVGNSIISAYLHGKALRDRSDQAQAKLDFEKQVQEDHKAEVERAFKEHQRVADLQFAHQKTGEELARTHVQMAYLDAISKGQVRPPDVINQSPDQQEAMRGLNDLSTQNWQGPSGTTPPQYSTESQIRPDINLPGGVNIPGSMYRTPEEQGQANAQIAGPTIDLHEQAKQADLEAQFKRQMAVEGVKGGFKLQSEREKSIDAGKQLDKKLAGNITVANINAAARRYAADHKGELSAEDTQDISNQVKLNATGLGPVPSGKDFKHAAGIYISSDNVPIQQKTQDQLKAMGSIPQIIQDLNDFTSLLAEHKGIGPVATSLLAKVPQSELAVRMKQLNIDVPTIARVLESQQGRLTMQQIQLAKDSMASGNITRSDGEKLVKNIANLYRTKLINEVFSGVPEGQRKSILEAHPITINRHGADWTSKDGGMSWDEVK